MLLLIPYRDGYVSVDDFNLALGSHASPENLWSVTTLEGSFESSPFRNKAIKVGIETLPKRISVDVHPHPPLSGRKKQP